MDVVLQGDLLWAMGTVMERQQRTFCQNKVIGALHLQGAGPHFCPGGNPNPVIPEGTGLWDINQYTGYFGFVRAREFHVPTAVSVHGATAGGGCAKSLNQGFRTCDAKNTICFGNVSRGAVPGMMLSKNIVSCMGLPGAIDMYLMDHTYSAYGGVGGGYYTHVFKGIQEAKMSGQRMVAAKANNPILRSVLPHMLFYIDEARYSVEGYAIAFGAKQGQMFQNVDVKKILAAKQSVADEKALEEKKMRERYGIKPEGMPNKLPGQFPKYLVSGEQAVCTQCGITATNGLFSPAPGSKDKSEMFYCMDCWVSWGKADDEGADKKKKKKKGEQKKEEKVQLATQEPPTLEQKAAMIHGPGVNGGILSWATWSCKSCCWSSGKDIKESEAFRGDQGGMAVYASQEEKNRHKPAYMAAKMSDWGSSKRIECSQLAEAASFAMWRERCVGTGVKEIRKPVPVGSLDEFDARLALQSVEAFNLKDAELPLLVVDQGHPSLDAVLFDDPKERFPEGYQWWWQFLGSESSKTAAAVVLHALIGVTAKAGKSLSCAGREVTNFGVCKGKYIGKVTPIAVEDYSRGNIFPIPRRTPEGQLLDHHWVFVRMDNGEEYCIDLAAAQYGNTDLSNKDCPLIFKPKKEFDELYQETDRSWDPIDAYRDIFKDMMEDRMVKVKDRGDTPWYKRINHIEVFIHVASKLCGLLGLA